MTKPISQGKKNILIDYRDKAGNPKMELIETTTVYEHNNGYFFKGPDKNKHQVTPAPAVTVVNSWPIDFTAVIII